MENPLVSLQCWIQAERESGAPDPQQAVLSTVTSEKVPHARVVAIREINENDLLFFTQRGSRKVAELTDNPRVAMTFWFELNEREVIIEGKAIALSVSDNEHYWKTYSRVAQVRFYSYAPTSGQPIANKQEFEDRKKQIELDFEGKTLPLSELYCGYRILPERMIFYTYRRDELSDVFEYRHIKNKWLKQRLSP